MNVNEDEIDIRPYILGLIRFSWLVILLALIFGGISFLLNRRQPFQYVATANILVTRTRATLSLSQQFPTITEPIDAVSRMNALISLAKSDALAEKVIQTLGDKLPPAMRTINAIKGPVDISSQGDLILIGATTQNPRLSADIANAWAQQTVSAINSAYSQDLPLQDIEAQLKTSKADYEKNQSALEDFIKTNQINILQEKINEAKILFNKIGEDRTAQITFYSQRKQDMDNLSVQAEALKQQIQSGSQSQAGSLGDALAVLNYRAMALGLNTINNSSDDNSMTSTILGNSNNQGSSPIVISPNSNGSTQQNGVFLNLQLNDASILKDSTTNYIADLNSLAQLAKAESAKADQALQDLTKQVNQGSDDNELNAISAQIQSLQSELEKEQSQQKELTSQRDIAWQAYYAISQKEAELANSGQTDNQVSLASPAVTPEQPAPRSSLNKAFLAAGIGFILGVVIIVAVIWWQQLNKKEELAPGKSSLTSDAANR